MKLFILLAGLILASFSLPAQFAPLSPPAHLKQLVGNTFVTIDYDRPIARGRKIFGGLVPYNKLWQAGAGGTDIRFDGPVKIYNQVVPAGVYALLVIPGEKEWTVIINTAKNGRLNYDPAQDFVNVCVPVVKPDRFYESFSLELDVRQSGAQLYISWTDVQVSIPISTPADELAMAFIDSLLAAPLTDNEEPYFRAANYLMFNRQQVEKAIPLIQHFIKLENTEYGYRMLTRAHLQLGNKDAALATMKKGVARARQEFPEETDLATIMEYWGKLAADIAAL